MIIGYDGSRAFLPHRTGTENYSYQILRHLALIDHKNQYIVFTRPLASQGPTLRGWPKNFQFKTLTYPKLWTQIGLAKETFITPMDVLFIPSHTLPIIHKPGLKTVVTVHDLGAEYLPKTHQLKQRLYLNFMTQKQLKSATHLIAVSQSTKDDIVARAKVLPNKISVVYEGYDQRLFRPIKEPRLQKTLVKFGLKKNNYFLFVGTIQPRKNLERSIKAYAEFLKADGPQSTDYRGAEVGSRKTEDILPKLVLVGSKGWLSDAIYKLPKQLGIEDSIKFLGRVEDEELPALYRGAIALLLPSLFEGFGLPIIEAMACGCPVLTSKVSSMPEVAGKAAILVDPYSVTSISEGIAKLRNQSTRQKLIKLGFENTKRFSWQEAARETLKIITTSG